METSGQSNTSKKPKKGRKKSQKKADPLKPTRPRSAYNFFFQRTRARLAAEEAAGASAAKPMQPTTATGSDIGREKFNRLGKKIGELWAVVR